MSSEVFNLFEMVFFSSCGIGITVLLTFRGVYSLREGVFFYLWNMHHSHCESRDNVVGQIVPPLKLVIHKFVLFWILSGTSSLKN